MSEHAQHQHYEKNSLSPGGGVFALTGQVAELADERLFLRHHPCMDSTPVQRPIALLCAQMPV